MSDKINIYFIQITKFIVNILLIVIISGTTMIYFQEVGIATPKPPLVIITYTYYLQSNTFLCTK